MSHPRVRALPIGRFSRIFVVATALVLFTALLLAPRAYAEEVRLQHNGLTLNAQLAKAGGKALKDGVILILHGTLAHNRMELIDNVQKQLTERGFNTLAINLSYSVNDRHGMYDCSVPSHHRHTDALDEIGAWITWLKQQGAGPITLLGHSRGGNQIAWYASEHAGSEINKVVLIAPQTWTAGSAAPAYQKRYGADLNALLGKLAKAEQSAVVGPIDILYCPKTRASAASLLSYYREESRFDTPSLLATIKMPVLVVAAETDEVVPGLIERTQPQADGKKIQLKVISGADHFFRDLYADDAVEIISAFLL